MVVWTGAGRKFIATYSISKRRERQEGVIVKNMHNFKKSNMILQGGFYLQRRKILQIQGFCTLSTKFSTGLCKQSFSWKRAKSCKNTILLTLYTEKARGGGDVATNFTLQSQEDSAIIIFVICAGLVYRYYSGFPSLRVTGMKTLCLQRFRATKECVKQNCHAICQVIKFYTCRVSLSVELLVPNQTRRVRLPYPAPYELND